MTLKTRKILFYGLALLFLIVATVILLYSRGTIFDFKTLKFIQTGGIYIESEPPDALIELDSEPIRNSVGILQAGTFINNLIPGKYSLVVSKDGYKSWHKETEVLPSEVAVFDRVILMKAEEGQRIRQKVEDFYESEGRLIIKNGVKLTAEDMPIVGSEVVNLRANGSVITMDSKTGNYYLANLSSLTSSLNLSLMFNNLKESALHLPGTVKINKIYPYPYNDRKFVVKTGKGLYAMDAERLNLELITDKASEFALSKSEVFWLEDNELFAYNLPLRTKLKLVEIPIKEKVSGIEASPNGTLIAFREANGRLTIVNKDSGKIKLVADKVKELAFSPNSKLIAFVDYDGPLNIYDTDKEKYLELKTGLKNIREVEWYRDNSHLFLTDNDNLYFAEIDTRLPENVYLIAKAVKKFIYDKSSNQIYFNTLEGLFSFEI